MSFIIGAGAAAIYEMQTAEEAHSREVGVHLRVLRASAAESIINPRAFWIFTCWPHVANNTRERGAQEIHVCWLLNYNGSNIYFRFELEPKICCSALVMAPRHVNNA